MVMPSVDDEKATIEMHHGPILTLFDCCSIVTMSMIHRGEKLTTPRVAKIVLQ